MNRYLMYYTQFYYYLNYCANNTQLYVLDYCIKDFRVVRLETCGNFEETFGVARNVKG